MSTLSRAAFAFPALLILALLPPAEAFASTTGSGNVATETRNVASFQAISASGAIDVLVKQGSTQSLQVTADDKLLPLLETIVESSSEGATLKVGWKKSSPSLPRGRVQINVVMPQLSAVSTAGAGDIRVESFSTPALKLAVAGAGDIRVQGLRTDELAVSVSGAGDVAASGSAPRVRIKIAGSGDVRMADLKADEVSVTIAGSGDAVVNAERKLDVRIAGSGDVSYSGAATLKTSVAGSGSVKKR